MTYLLSIVQQIFKSDFLKKVSVLQNAVNTNDIQGLVTVLNRWVNHHIWEEVIKFNKQDIKQVINQEQLRRRQQVIQGIEYQVKQMQSMEQLNPQNLLNKSILCSLKSDFLLKKNKYYDSQQFKNTLFTHLDQLLEVGKISINKKQKLSGITSQLLDYKTLNNPFNILQVTRFQFSNKNSIKKDSQHKYFLLLGSNQLNNQYFVKNAQQKMINCKQNSNGFISTYSNQSYQSKQSQNQQKVIIKLDEIPNTNFIIIKSTYTNHYQSFQKQYCLKKGLHSVLRQCQEIGVIVMIQKEDFIESSAFEIIKKINNIFPQNYEKIMNGIVFVFSNFQQTDITQFYHQTHQLLKKCRNQNNMHSIVKYLFELLGETNLIHKYNPQKNDRKWWQNIFKSLSLQNLFQNPLDNICLSLSNRCQQAINRQLKIIYNNIVKQFKIGNVRSVQYYINLLQVFSKQNSECILVKQNIKEQINKIFKSQIQSKSYLISKLVEDNLLSDEFVKQTHMFIEGLYNNKIIISSYVKEWQLIEKLKNQINQIIQRLIQSLPSNDNFKEVFSTIKKLQQISSRQETPFQNKISTKIDTLKYNINKQFDEQNYDKVVKLYERYCVYISLLGNNNHQNLITIDAIVQQKIIPLLTRLISKISQNINNLEATKQIIEIHCKINNLFLNNRLKNTLSLDLINTLNHKKQILDVKLQGYIDVMFRNCTRCIQLLTSHFTSSKIYLSKTKQKISTIANILTILKQLKNTNISSAQTCLSKIMQNIDQYQIQQQRYLTTQKNNQCSIDRIVMFIYSVSILFPIIGRNQSEIQLIIEDTITLISNYLIKTTITLKNISLNINSSCEQLQSTFKTLKHIQETIRLLRQNKQLIPKQYQYEQQKIENISFKLKSVINHCLKQIETLFDKSQQKSTVSIKKLQNSLKLMTIFKQVNSDSEVFNYSQKVVSIFTKFQSHLKMFKQQSNHVIEFFSKINKDQIQQIKFDEILILKQTILKVQQIQSSKYLSNLVSNISDIKLNIYSSMNRLIQRLIFYKNNITNNEDNINSLQIKTLFKKIQTLSYLDEYIPNKHVSFNRIKDMIKDIILQNDQRVKKDVETCIDRKHYSKINSIYKKYVLDKKLSLKIIICIDNRIRELLNILQKQRVKIMFSSKLTINFYHEFQQLQSISRSLDKQTIQVIQSNLKQQINKTIRGSKACVQYYFLTIKNKVQYYCESYRLDKAYSEYECYVSYSQVFIILFQHQIIVQSNILTIITDKINEIKQLFSQPIQQNKNIQRAYNSLMKNQSFWNKIQQLKNQVDQLMQNQVQLILQSYKQDKQYENVKKMSLYLPQNYKMKFLLQLEQLKSKRHSKVFSQKTQSTFD